jgi:CHAD domain-containing protein
MAKARAVPGLRADEPFALAAGRVVGVRAEEVFAHARGVLDTGDIERVHDMRVATRRLRAVLEIFAPCFPRKAHSRALADVKALADALGTRRDPDVQIAALEGIAASATRAEHAGIGLLVDDLRAEQERGNAALADALAEAERNELRSRLATLAAEARER